MLRLNISLSDLLLQHLTQITPTVKCSSRRTSWTCRWRRRRRSQGRTTAAGEETRASAARWRSPEGVRSVRTGDPSGGPPSLPVPVVVAGPLGPPPPAVARRSACIWRTNSPASDSNACGPSMPRRRRGCGIGRIWACAGTARSTTGRGCPLATDDDGPRDVGRAPGNDGGASKRGGEGGAVIAPLSTIFTNKIVYIKVMQLYILQHQHETVASCVFFTFCYRLFSRRLQQYFSIKRCFQIVTVRLLLYQ